MATRPPNIFHSQRTQRECNILRWFFFFAAGSGIYRAVFVVGWMLAALYQRTSLRQLALSLRAQNEACSIQTDIAMHTMQTQTHSQIARCACIAQILRFIHIFFARCGVVNFICLCARFRVLIFCSVMFPKVLRV